MKKETKVSEKIKRQQKEEKKLIKSVFAFYGQYKHLNEYTLKIGNSIISVNSNLFEIQPNVIYKNRTKSYENTDMRITTLRPYTIERLHPNKINNKYFWKMAKTKYPLVSVCGNPVNTITECNKKTLKMAQNSGVLTFLDDYIENKNNISFFEIGYGHGNIYFHLKEKYLEKVKYTGIDYYKHNSLKNIKDLRIINKSGIPEDIMDNTIDVFYSFNVLQHCSQEDRNLYFKQTYDKLKTGGIFIGGAFFVTDENKDKPFWGTQDINGRKYCAFFNQFTEVDEIDEFKQTVSDIGFSINNISLVGRNYYSFILKK